MHYNLQACNTFIKFCPMQSPYPRYDYVQYAHNSMSFIQQTQRWLFQWLFLQYVYTAREYEMFTQFTWT